MDSDLKGKRLLIGIKQSTQAVQQNTVESVYVAKDAAVHIREPFEALCKDKQLPIHYFDTKQQLGRACGIDVGATCVVVLI
ncbi:MAG: ribosomal L7Ae/L30e/S12e/Gadd45 family protein [Clostridia bacterium]|nr:ribosomal L7Ae/L30e/S12e/Gadd45 family protein [Clostridia bacterium]